MLPLDRWLELCKRLGVKRGPGYHAQLYKRLAHYYNHPGRHYHNLDHIRNCLVKFDEVRHLLDDPDCVELAIWFHDAIYEVWADDNEQRSVSLAMFFIQELMFPPLFSVRLREIMRKVTYFIERTQYFSKDEMWESRTNDARFMVDIDLSSGLGGLWYDFQRKNILYNNEFEWMDRVKFQKNLLEGFTMFHGRSPFYLTDYFRERYEEQTKANLERAIGELEDLLFPPKAQPS